MDSGNDVYTIKELKQHLKEVKNTGDLFALLGQMLDYLEAQEEAEPMGESMMETLIKRGRLPIKPAKSGGGILLSLIHI